MSFIYIPLNHYQSIYQFQVIFLNFFFLCIFHMVLTSDIVPLYDERAAVQEDCDPGDSLQRTVATIVGQTIQSKEICF